MEVQRQAAWVERMCDKARQQTVQAIPHSCADKPGGTMGEQDEPWNSGFHHGKLKRTPGSKKSVGAVVSARETPSLIRVCWGCPQGPKTYTNPPTCKSAPERAQSAGGRRGKAGEEPSKQHCSLSKSSPTVSIPHSKDGCPTLTKTSGSTPLPRNRCIETKKNGPNESTDQNSRKRTKWRGPRQPIRYRVQNTGNQDDQSELTEFGPKMKEVMKAIQSEIKENIQGTNSEGKETRM